MVHQSDRNSVPVCASIFFTIFLVFPVSSFYSVRIPSVSSTSLATRRFRRILPLGSTTAPTSYIIPSLNDESIANLNDSGYVVLPNYLSPDLVSNLLKDVEGIRASGRFKTAKIGQDFSNKLNTEVRVAETCFIGRSKSDLGDSAARMALYDSLDRIREGLSGNLRLDEIDDGGDLLRCAPALDPGLDELLYARYPRGGFYRRHRDAIDGSASVLRCYSLLLYLNEEWTEKDGGQLRMHFDGFDDEVPEGGEEDYLDVEPRGGTLVIFKSDQVPHEVLDTWAQRTAIVGWYNRAATTSDIQSLSSQEDVTRLGMLAVAAVLVFGGVASILLQ